MIYCGDNIDILRGMADNSVDAIVADPPYGISFMAKKWDYDVPSVELWAECLRVLKPGGHLLSFAGTRTQHRMACRIEDAGFEIRDMIAWIYSQGFPKSLDISKAIDKAAGAERQVVGFSAICRSAAVHSGGQTTGVPDAITAPATDAAKQWGGFGTALKPALEPITLARKPLEKGLTIAQNVLKWGTGGINVDGCRVGADGGTAKAGKPSYKPGISLNGSLDGSLNGGSCIGLNKGRWPANFLHDGSEDVVSLFPQTGASKGLKNKAGENVFRKNTFNDFVIREDQYGGYDDAGSAARFFYCPKASKRDRDEGLEDRNCSQYNGVGTLRDNGRETQPIHNTHPTVKPTGLMQYLCRLITPPGGIVLDPFCGSGSTGKAAILEGFSFIGIEREQEYVDVAKARIAYAEKEMGIQEPAAPETKLEPANEVFEQLEIDFI